MLSIFDREIEARAQLESHQQVVRQNAFLVAHLVRQHRTRSSYPDQRPQQEVYPWSFAE